jgi:cystathionine beta-lyase family protein involved in aluminum resistance
VGANPFGYRTFFQGLFLAPSVVEASIKSATLFAKIFHDLGYPVMPEPLDGRYDITQSIQLDDADLVVDFCNMVQRCSPIDSFVSPEPWEMPGYDHKVVMAAGTFIEGASIELSADAPITKPYSVYLQGGLTYAHCKYCVISILENFLKQDSRL